MEDPLGVGQLQERLFVESSRVAVVDVFKRGLMFEFGFLEQPTQASVFPIRLFFLDEEPDEFGVGKLAVLRMADAFGKALGHAEEFQFI